MSIIKLSICIATYNRCRFLYETLLSIVKQLTNEVEVIIVDGASTDETYSVVNKFQKSQQNIKYIFLEKKGGVDQDFCQSVEMAKGKYCWLFSDDDLLKSGAIESVLNAIERDDFSLIIVNAELRSFDMNKVFRKSILFLKKDRIYDNDIQSQNHLLAETGSYLSFIGCVIIEREEWLKREKEEYFGTEFVHIGVIFQNFLPKPTLCLSEIHISIRLGNSQWSQRAFKIWIINWPKLIWSFNNYSKKSKRAVVCEEPLRQYWKLMYFRAMGLFTKKEYDEALKHKPQGKIVKIVSKIILITSGKGLNIFFNIYARVRKRIWMIDELKNSKYYIHVKDGA